MPLAGSATCSAVHPSRGGPLRRCCQWCPPYALLRARPIPRDQSDIVAVFPSGARVTDRSVIELSKQSDDKPRCHAGRDSGGNRECSLLDVSVVLKTSRNPCGPAFIRGDFLRSTVCDGLRSHCHILPSSRSPHCSLMHTRGGLPVSLVIAVFVFNSEQPYATQIPQGD